MNPVPLSDAKDEDARHVMAALIRAAARAREIAILTDTHLIIGQDGKLVRIAPKDLIQNISK
jgi:adenylate kinase